MDATRDAQDKKERPYSWNEGRIEKIANGEMSRPKARTGMYGNRTHRELCSNPPPVLKTGASTSRTNTPDY